MRLAFPLISSPSHLNASLDGLLDSMLKNCQMMVLCRLLINGSDQVAKALVFSRIWHATRILVPPVAFLRPFCCIVEG
jgi:hypothetical protein